MSKKKRLLSLLLCLAMSSAASSAFAAAKVSKTFTTAPTVKATFPTKGVDSYDTENYTVTPSQPEVPFLRSPIIKTSMAYSQKNYSLLVSIKNYIN